jgi:hypothetical protein
MAGSGDILAVDMELHGEADLADELAYLRANHMHAENAIIVGFGYDLDEAFALVPAVYLPTPLPMTTTSYAASAATGITGASIFEPPLQRPVLLIGEGRVQVVDRHIGRGD